MKNSVIVRAVAALAVAGAALVAVPAQANPAGTGVVIHEIYVNGGSAGATYRNKFVELRNPTDTKVDLNGWSIQYRSASGVAAFSGVTALGDHHIEPGGTFVISGNSNAANGAMLPTPDVAGSIGFSGSSGTIALSTSTTPLTGTPDVVLADSNLVDLIGYGGSLTFETAVKSSGTSVTSSLNRTNAADTDTDTDTDNNSTDFTAGSPLPQPCGAACEGSGVPEEPPVVKTIAQIQGTGAASPIIGTNVTTRGVVTAVYPTGGFDGAYIQTEGTGGALDLGTHTASDGVFVFSSELAAGVDKGDFVEVTGKVTEFGGLTEVTTSTGAFSVLDETPDVVRAAAVTIPSSATTRESLEGMLLAPQGDYTVTNNYTTNRFAEVGLADGDTPLDTPTNVVAPGVQATALQTQNNARLITLDDGASIDFTGASNQGIALPWLTPDNEVRVGAPVDFDDPVVLDFRFGWKLQPTGRLLAGGDEPVTFGDTRSAAPKPVGGDVRIGTFNVLNYFSTTGAEYTGGICSYYKDRQGNPITANSCTNNGPRGAADEASFQRQQAKIVTAINTLDANVVSLEEVENSINLGLDRDTALSDLTDALNGAAGEERWAFVPSPADVPAGEDVIRTAFIYQPDVVTPVGASRILIGASAFDNAREPLAQTFRLTAGSAASAFAVVVNHFKSKGSSGLPQDNDQGDGQGASNYSRTLQAAALVTFAQDFAGDAGTSRVFLAGDFNSYNEEDPLKIIEDAGYVNVPRQLTHKETYQFGGQIGSLDHVFASADAFSRVTGADTWNNNAYESLAREYSRFNANVTDFYRAD
ncbi:ExeM/NucH family extracellular endonuclease, partial [Aeromicrobium sp.]|uniref:ExeM/NucH family extracellular endonuclease n=1 Tax=Aeromicrobium sp. TaxID=1871063 RepID=UPI001994EEA5